MAHRLQTVIALGTHVTWKRHTDGAETLVWPCVALSSPERNPRQIRRPVQCGNRLLLSRFRHRLVERLLSRCD